MGKKFSIILMLIIFLSGCKVNSALYRYESYPAIGFNNSYNEIFDISAAVIDIEKEGSSIESIRVYDRQYNTFSEIISPTIKVIDMFGKEYILKVNEQHRYAVNIYKQGVILKGEFKAYIGKIRRKDGTIVNLPPLIFKEYVDVDKWNPILDTMNIETGEKVFSGTVEDYEKERNKTKTKK